MLLKGFGAVGAIGSGITKSVVSKVEGDGNNLAESMF